MRHPCRTLIAACLLIPSSSSSPPPTPTGAGGLDGTWVEVVRTPTREEAPGYHPPRSPSTLVIDGDSLAEASGGRAVRRSLLRRLPGRSPEAIDLVTVVGGEFWLTRAIVRVEGDSLTIREGGRDRARPTDFEPRPFDAGAPGPMTLLREFRRRSP